MTKSVIEVHNVSKAYQLGKIGTGTIASDLQRWYATNILRKEDPYLKIGETNDRTTKGNSNIVWSLKDINFSINQGEAVGIIGRNGAGKSTLLKILSRVTTPTTGKIRIKGRVASLLEVGTGFHPELTGRENIFLNGAILGMRKHEITRKLEEIIDFSGVERYIDTPVKRYSSGMYVRLAFAVAAHLESEILIVDEVLAVGDAEFQKKCLGKMGEVSKGDGRTVLFVSHNMGAINQLCNKGIVLVNGALRSSGNIQESIGYYLNTAEKSNYYEQPNNQSIPVCITSIELLSKNGQELFDIEDKIELKIMFTVNHDDGKRSVAVRLSKDQSVICTNFIHLNNDHLVNKVKGEYTVIMRNFPSKLLKAGTYTFDFFTGIMRSTPEQAIESKILFDLELTKGDNFSSVYSKERPGVIGLNLDWEQL